ncbi:MAG: peroxiredoxin [Synechococcales cyanobacterium RU_4_20]|nr:peroxiredoxin [Synechococcales cyanobacterium RU_4_20]NJR69563.1 peroxiredoxin [Synechococcales cyanobacterium CRU_2_2]
MIDADLARRDVLRILGVGAVAVLANTLLPQGAVALGGKLPHLNGAAPDFTLPTNTGQGQISLGDYLGQWVVLYFYPKDFTAGCTLEAQRFQRDLPEFSRRNTQVLGISADDVDSHAEFCESEGLRFPLLADVDGSVSKAYGSWIAPYSRRHTYLIDPTGKLRKIYLDVRPSIHSREVLADLEQLQDLA